MPAPTPSRSGKERPAREQKDLRQELAEKLIAQIESGTASWQKPWVAGEVKAPLNAVTGKPYRGVNREWLLLVSPDQTDPRWCTYKQAEEQGWQVRKGEHGTSIEVWKEYDHTLTEKEKAEKRHAREQIPDPVMRKKALEEIPDTEKRLGVQYYSVFHASQIDGIPPLERPEITHEIEGKPDERLPRLVEAMGVEFRTGGNRAFYRSSEDRVQMPPVEAFLTATGHDTTLLHELGHATGHESRLGRKLGNPFGSPEYAKEELRAEMSAAMTAMSLGIGFDPQAQNIEEGANIQQNGAYLASWLKALPEKDRKKELMAAIKDAQGISDYLIQRTPEIEREAEVEKSSAPSRGEAQELDADLVAHLRTYTQIRQGERTDLPAVGDDWPGGLPTGLGGDRIENTQQFLRNAAEQDPQRAERWAADLRGNPHEYGETVGLEADNIRGVATQMEQGVERMRNPQVGDLVRFEPSDPRTLKAMPYSGRVIARLDTTGGDFRYHLRAESGPDQGNEATVYGRDGQFRKIALDQAVGFDRALAPELHPEEVVHSVPDGLRRWMSNSQRLATEEGLRGEEKGFFQEKMQELESIIEQMPSTYQTQDLPDEQKPVGLRYFGPNGAQWFIIEKDRGGPWQGANPETDGPNGPRQTQAFGLADLGMDYPELGYINIEELTKIPQVELDYHFTPTNLLEVKKEHYPEMVRRISMGESLVKDALTKESAANLLAAVDRGEKTLSRERTAEAVFVKHGFPAKGGDAGEKLFTAIETKNVEELMRIYANMEYPVIDETFARLTGNDAGKTGYERKRQIAEWVGPEKAKAYLENPRYAPSRNTREAFHEVIAKHEPPAPSPTPDLPDRLAEGKVAEAHVSPADRDAGKADKPSPEKIKAYEAKQQARRERYRALAEKMQARAEAKLDQAHKMADAIPFGQPILVGHHSENRDRRYRGHIHKTFGQGFDLMDRAKYYERRSERMSNSISSDDPDAVQKLKEKLEHLKMSQEKMKAANAVIRKFRDPDERKSGLERIGFTAEQSDKILAPDVMGAIGFASYSLSNNNAEIRRIEERIKGLEKMETLQDRTTEYRWGAVRENKENNRIQFLFGGKPDEATRKLMKESGFRWAPSEKAWQRQWTGNAVYAARGAIRELNSMMPPEQSGQVLESASAEREMTPVSPTPEAAAWEQLREQTAMMPDKMDMLFEDTRKAAAKLDILDEAGQIELRRQYSKQLEEIYGIIREGPDRGADQHILALVNAGVPAEGLYQRPEMQRYRAVCDEQGARASAFRKELDENLKDRFREYGKEILRVVDSHSEVVPTERKVAAVFWKHGIMASEENQHVINFVRDVEEKNLPRLLSVIGHNSENPASQEAFTRLTGVPLGKTQSERVAQLEKWAGPEVVAAMQAKQAERSAAKAQERIHKNLYRSFEHLDSLQVRINSKAHGPGNDVVVNGKDYLLIKVSQGMDRVVSEKRGAVTQYRLRAEDGTSSGVKARELTDFAKAVLAVSPDGDVRQAFTTVGLPAPDKGLSDFLRERQEIWHGKHPDHQGFSNSVAGAEDFERRTVQEKPAHARAWVAELRKHSQMYGAISGLSQDSITAMSQRVEKTLEQNRVQDKSPALMPEPIQEKTPEMKVPAPTVRQPEMSTSTPVYRAPVRKTKTQGQEL